MNSALFEMITRINPLYPVYKEKNAVTHNLLWKSAELYIIKIKNKFKQKKTLVRKPGLDFIVNEIKETVRSTYHRT